jgi:hypothetical protein
MPRPTKLTKPVQARIIAAAAAGNTRRVCALAAGISERTLYDWINRGEDEVEPYLQFLQALHMAEAEAQVKAVANWQAAMPESWQACRDFLARRWPEDWGPKSRTEISGDGDAPLTIRTIHTLAELAMIPLDEDEAA